MQGGGDILYSIETNSILYESPVIQLCGARRTRAWHHHRGRFLSTQPKVLLTAPCCWVFGGHHRKPRRRTQEPSILLIIQISSRFVIYSVQVTPLAAKFSEEARGNLEDAHKNQLRRTMFKSEVIGSNFSQFFCNSAHCAAYRPLLLSFQRPLEDTQKTQARTNQLYFLREKRGSTSSCTTRSRT